MSHVVGPICFVFQNSTLTIVTLPFFVQELMHCFIHQEPVILAYDIHDVLLCQPEVYRFDPLNFQQVLGNAVGDMVVFPHKSSEFNVEMFRLRVKCKASYLILWKVLEPRFCLNSVSIFEFPVRPLPPERRRHEVSDKWCRRWKFIYFGLGVDGDFF